MNGTKKLAALVVACIMVAAVGVPIVNGENADVAATVSGKSPVINSITFSGTGVTGTSVSLTPGPSATTTTPVTITAVIYCKNGPEAIDVVTADISPVIAGYSGPITMTEESTEPSAHTADYTTTIDIPSNTAPDDYTVTITATHRSKDGVVPGTGSNDLTVLPTLAIADLSAVAFGTLNPGGTSDAQTVQVTNLGNVDIRLGVEPSALRHDGDTIPADCITTTWESSTSIAVDNDASVPVTLAVPEGTPEGTYTGTIMFTPAEA